MTKYVWIVLSAATVFLCGCAVKPKYLAPDYRAPQILALLPFSNQTNDLDAPEMIRQLFFQMLPQRGYQSLPFAEIDEALKKNGISEGGQLRAIQPQELGKQLGVDALWYGDIIDFDYINVGYYQNRKVRIACKLIDTATGAVLWEDDQSVSTKNVALNAREAREELAKGLARKLIEKIAKTFLKTESIACVRKLLYTLPPGGQYTGAPVH
jgi:hypothetical protein